VGTGGNPSPDLYRATVSHIVSIVAAIRRQSPSGNRRVVLKDTAGSDYSVGYLTPAVIRHDTTYPCIIYLHGGIGSTRSDKGDSAYLMLDMLADSMELFLASPSANRWTPWWSPAGLSRILQTLRYMTLHYPINPDKVFLAGVSDGATGCWAAANSIASPFAGFIAVSGFGGMLPQLGMTLNPENLMQRPIYNVNAGNDRLYPIAAVNQFLDFMEQGGVGVRRMIYPDEEHGFDYRFKEASTLCGIIRDWSLPHGNGFRWKSSAAYPAVVGHCIAVERVGDASSFFVQGFCRSDTFFLHSTGLRRLQMYFDADDRCMQQVVFIINDKKSRHYKAITSNREMELLLMKQRCFPVIVEGLFFSIPL
jgi:acetyl esterase/lipase